MTSPPKKRPDKEKVIDEQWTDERIRSFLNTEPPSQTGVVAPGDPDYYVLLRAYQAMRVEDFKKFLDFFVSDGGNVEATGPQGRTLIDYIQNHRKAQSFISALKSKIDEPTRV